MSTLMNKKYVVIITSEDQRYDRKEKGLDFFSNNPWEGLLQDIISGDTFDELYGNGENEGMFYQLYSIDTGKRIGSGVFDPDGPREEIQLYESPDSLDKEITKDMIIKGLENQTIIIINNENDGDISAKIGDNWFYFCNSDDAELSVDEYLQKYDTKTIAEFIYLIINDEPIKGITNDDSTEWLYYKAILQENS